MDANSLTDQLFDILEGMLLENRAQDVALSLAFQLLPASEQAKVATALDRARVDERDHAAVQNVLARYRNQSLERTLAELQKVNWKKNQP